MQHIITGVRHWRQWPGALNQAITWTVFAGVFWWLNVLVLKGSGSLALITAYIGGL